MPEPHDEWFERLKALLESKYLAGTNARQQSGFGRDAQDWERYRRPIVDAIHRDGTFLDIGCANGLLMESVAQWAREQGYAIQPYGLDLSDALAALARERLGAWRERIFVGNALSWEPPHPFTFARTELVYVPPSCRRDYVERLLDRVVAPGGRLIVCSYGSTRPEGARAELIVDELDQWGIPYAGVTDAVHSDHGFVITRVVWLAR
jgi:SAM-dependent methyltransferase